MLIIHIYQNTYFHKHHKLHQFYRNFRSLQKSNIDSPRSSYKGLRKAEKIHRKLNKRSIYFSFSLEKKMAKAVKNSGSSQTSVRIDLIVLYLSLSLVNIFLTSSFGFSHARSLSLPSLVKLAKLQQEALCPPGSISVIVNLGFRMPGRGRCREEQRWQPRVSKTVA